MHFKSTWTMLLVLYKELGDAFVNYEYFQTVESSSTKAFTRIKMEGWLTNTVFHILFVSFLFQQWAVRDWNTNRTSSTELVALYRSRTLEAFVDARQRRFLAPSCFRRYKSKRTTMQHLHFKYMDTMHIAHYWGYKHRLH